MDNEVLIKIEFVPVDKDIHRNIFSFYFRLVFLLYVYGDTSHTHVEIRL